MPGMNGLDAARMLHASECEALLILFTLHCNAIMPGEAEAAGISAVIPKPDIAALLRYIDGECCRGAVAD